MPKLRLSKVISDKQIDRKSLSSEVNAAINSLLPLENNIEKINVEIAKELRAIAESLNVSVFDLFIPAEKFYRLNIFDYLNEPEYSGSSKEKLKQLYSKLPNVPNKISFSLLAIYATQVLPERLLKDSDLETVGTLLKKNWRDFKQELPLPPRQTISVDSILIRLGINIDELAVILDIPKELIPWINQERTAREFLNDSSICYILGCSPQNGNWVCELVCP
jgi:hypothetical protein